LTGGDVIFKLTGHQIMSWPLWQSGTETLCLDAWH